METIALDTPVVAITEAAARRLLLLLKRKGMPDGWTRLGVRGGGCSGLSYVMRPEEAPSEGDHAYQAAGARIVVDARSARFLAGSMLDFSIRNLMDGGWVWSNPNAARSCGCGTSFAPK